MTQVREWIMANALVLALALAGVMTVVAAVQTVRLDGFQIRAPLIGTVGPQGWIAKAQKAERERAEFVRLQLEAEARYLAEIAELSRKSEQLAKEVDRAEEQFRASQLELARRFIAAGGVRGQTNRDIAAPDPTGGDGAGLGEGGGRVPVVDGMLATVMVYASDVEICTINTSRLMAAREWGLELESR
jgi:hypothetical protein